MGNSPSKNDPLPKGLNQPSTSVADATSSNDDLDPDERSSALSRSKFSPSSAIKIEQNYLNSTNVNVRQNSIKRQSKRRPSDLALDLEIGANMAALLSTSNSNSPGSKQYGSSVDSDMSPVFTSVEPKDNELILSFGSYSSSPRSSTADDIPIANLGVIRECNEPTPTPEAISIPKSSIKDDLKSLSKKMSTVSINSLSSESPPLPPVNSTKAQYPIDLDLVIERLISIGHERSLKKRSRKSKDKLPFSNDEIKYILNKSRSIFLLQPTLLRLAPPVKVVGDLHGQFLDLIRIFDTCGYPPDTNYLFLGDYVDRGYKSLETILLLLCFKIKYPGNFFMLRGNHESANITKIYGFYDECKRRLSNLSGNHKMWKLFVDVFNTLPIAATINERIFCIHGGLSPELTDLAQIQDIKRPTDVPDRGLLADLLWSDPDASVRTFSLTDWPKNDRGVSYCFGKKHVDYFCNHFQFDLIVRGHMVVEDGYEFFNKRKLVTIFSAPNYCGEFNNYGAVMSVDKSLCCSFDLLKPN